MRMQKEKNILVVGVGNTLRGDDGIGASVCNAVEQLHLPGISTTTTHQLHIEQAESFSEYDIVIIVDAAVTGDGVVFTEVTEECRDTSPASHHINASTLLALLKQLYKKDIRMMLCAVRGENFEMGEQLSTNAKKNAGIAAGAIISWLDTL